MGLYETYALLEIVFLYSPFGMVDDGVFAGWTFQSDEDNIWGERGMEVRSRENCLGGTKLPLVIVRSKFGRNSGLKQNRRPNVNSDSLQSHIEGYTE